MTGNDIRLEADDILAIAAGRHSDPFGVLGWHDVGAVRVVRAFVPGADEVAVIDEAGAVLARLEQRDPQGVFEGSLGSGPRIHYRLRAKNDAGSWEFEDPYAFGPVLGPLDDYYAAEGTHLRLYDKLGAHPIVHEGVAGVHFAVWAPNAQRVSVVGDFNQWDGRRHLMRHRADAGVYEIFIPDLPIGTIYKYEIVGADGTLQPLKADPMAFQSELRPNTASIVAGPLQIEWDDAAYLEARTKRDPRREPMTIYEAHLGSWQRGPDGEFLSYDELAETLVPYVVDMGFTHIELLPVSEHPLDASWGYQPTGLFAPTARHGDPDGFARFVNAAHKAGIGVILDWVPAHFPTDAHGLRRFDGTALYEHEDPRRGFHPDWNTAIYNFGRTEVSNFLTNNALFWLEQFHIDGLRVDAVASMLYLDYSRRNGEWLPNKFGGKENLEAIAFLKRLNEIVYAQHPGVLMIAEESTAWPGVSHPVYAGGLGFGFKWNMGFMNDTLRYMSRESIYRRWHHDDITFGLLYAFSENFILPLSHDEVVHGKASLLHKMAGDDWQRFASLRAYLALMWGYPGKKLLFMGQEFAQRDEWSESRALDWGVVRHLPHGGMQRLVRDLNRLNRQCPALHERDCEPEGFRWLIVDDSENSAFAWARVSGDGTNLVAVVSSLTPVPRHGYRVPLPRAGRWIERLNTDARDYGGSDVGNGGAVQAIATEYDGVSAVLTLPPLATLYLEWECP
ncbi:1,4-alpha-glucan branching protein GlgB [Blastochloris viridis]|uniref:1,4-alpha-glucan branching enzyme GlgB n=1 Tax=Blastochloris viridis TaxID=1079 RepID=A0A0H5BEP4_BLAVI|nr:1,4-alpha-glucan branching protein GlgB [Blastochloris viridis]ALK07922.1 1,4-alpha-glucan branching enzyme GlgB [Blastochloris viridis]BAR98826.1 1,4-alpha-glucan (glycogen) branching enzyme [Blastochloris viridis]CUU43844.1 1,4-alpha-glucan branching enzyme GlgB [Blastochloris viridis]